MTLAVPDLAETRRRLAAIPADRFRHVTEAALAAHRRHELATGSGKAAAVLVPVFARADGPHIWLLRRPTAMRSHAGQIAFPGGKRDDDDRSLRETALRECKEEIGLGEDRVRAILGVLDDVLTITGYAVTPFVAWVDPWFVPVPNPEEVARVFSAPLAAFLDGETGLSANMPLEIDGETVWGATASIARGFAAIVGRALT